MPVGIGEGALPGSYASQRYLLKTSAKYLLRGWKPYTCVRISRGTLGVGVISREPADLPRCMTHQNVWSWSLLAHMQALNFYFEYNRVIGEKQRDGSAEPPLALEGKPKLHYILIWRGGNNFILFLIPNCQM
jgi:hypothetical protein